MNSFPTREKFKVSIGIPAYNEGRNIRRLLDELSRQHQENFELIETIVVSDGSSDNTVEEARASALSNVEVIAHTDRQGQAARQNEILGRFKGDLLVLLNADVLPGDEYMLNKAVSVFHKDPNVGLLGIKHVPMPARTFIEQVVNFGVAMKADIFMKINGWDNLFNCRGGARVFSREFSDKFRWDIHAAEDAYSYTRCKELGFKFYYSDGAFIYYRSPSTFKDHLKQSVRFVRSQHILNKLSAERKNGPLPTVHKLEVLKILVVYFIKNPFLWISYIVLFVISRASYWFMKSDPVKYDTSSSSKQVSA